MKWWLLRPIDKDAQEGPWDPWYDRAFGFVVRAETETQARALATTKGGQEVSVEPTSWTDPGLSSCIELAIDGPAEVVLSDVHWA